MYTLDIKKKMAAYFGLSAFLYIFNMIYEYFSFGEYSLFMRNMYLIPLTGIAMLAVLGITLKDKIDTGFILLFNSAIAIFISGCIVRGVIEISGRSSDYDTYYIAAGSLFLAGAIIRQIFILNREKKN